jgi:hypothetical protein
MSPEAPINNDCFQFTEKEQLDDRISRARFMVLVDDPNVDVNDIKISTNAFGEFMFVTLSCRTKPASEPLTFYGLGYHEQRERWITKYWRWYESIHKAEELGIIPKQEARAQIQEREDFTRANAATTPIPSRRAQLYELMAHLTDEDGALTELEYLDQVYPDDIDGVHG